MQKSKKRKERETTYLRLENTDQISSSEEKTRTIERIPVLVVERPVKLAGIEFELEKKSTVFGRSKECEALIDESSVSRRHALFERSNSNIFVKDLNSTNGTFVNGKRILNQKLADGDRIKLGRVVLRFEIRTSAEHEVKDEYYLDNLTGVYNRKFFDAKAKKIISAKSISSLIFIDLDDLKKINDTKGHSAGDEALRKLASILKKSIRGDDVVSRYGGDEFVLLLSGADLDASIEIVKRIIDRVSKEDFSISAGISVYPRDGKELEKLIKVADSRLYKAKSEGKGIVVNE